VTPPRRFLLVGLTGGIATGKSTVAATLRRLGAEVIDADQLARDVVAPGEPALAEIVREFGDVRQPDGTLDRKKLAAIVFDDPARRKRLEAITHPAIRARFAARLEALAAAGFEGLVFFDAPVMIESGNYRRPHRRGHPAYAADGPRRHDGGRGHPADGRPDAGRGEGEARRSRDRQHRRPRGHRGADTRGLRRAPGRAARA
jgi:hypothetical protein